MKYTIKKIPHNNFGLNTGYLPSLPSGDPKLPPSPGSGAQIEGAGDRRLRHSFLEILGFL